MEQMAQFLKIGKEDKKWNDYKSQELRYGCADFEVSNLTLVMCKFALDRLSRYIELYGKDEDIDTLSRIDFCIYTFESVILKYENPDIKLERDIDLECAFEKLGMILNNL